MKLCILGGGGFRTPYVYQALLRDQGSPRVDRVALYDIDADRLGVMAGLLAELATEFPDAPLVEPTQDLEVALDGADFVFAALRVGGLEGRRCDEHIALDLGVLGQETTGPGGLSYALRSVPVMVDIARTIRRVAPQAYVMNFTNPAGIITEAMQRVLGDRVLGICDTPSGLGRRVAGLLGLDHSKVQMDYVGLNHLGWMRRVLYEGRDILPEVLSDDTRLAVMEEGEVFGTEWIQALGAIPNEYLYYYYFNREAIAGIRASGTTRGDFLALTQPAFYREAAAHGHGGVADLWRRTVDRRGASYMAEAKGGTQDAPTGTRDVELDPAHQGYAGVALAVMAAISRNERATMILNVRNRGTIGGLPDDAVVEVPTVVDANGVHPLTTAPPDLHQIGLMSQVKSVEQHIIEAALTGSRREAVTGVALHPLVDSVNIARRLVDGYIAEIPGVAAVLTR
ncbi:6-phospho-beta-glucosidase [Brachybacterium sp. AOP25-B2-12]|uniref:6-phospho-beta-glucosidase n=1 Tax=Brachybacterium sp. AOP25-B2-12 TaxID=3457710 RepID=UPI004033B4F8